MNIKLIAGITILTIAVIYALWYAWDNGVFQDGLSLEFNGMALLVSSVIFLIFMYFLWGLKLGDNFVWGVVPTWQRIMMSVVALPLFYGVAIKMIERG